MRTNLAVLVLVFLAASTAYADPSLTTALKEGKVKVHARAADRFGNMSLRITNPGTRPVTVDVTGSLLLPDQNDIQPMAIARLYWNRTGHMLTIEPGKTWSGVVPCVCLDRYSGVPLANAQFEMSTEKLPTPVQSALVAFRDRPQLKQDHTQYSVWAQTGRYANARAIRRLAGTLRFVPPTSNQIVVWPKQRFVLLSDGVVQRYQDTDDGRSIVREYTGGGFYGLFKVGSELCGVRRTQRNGVDFYRVYRFKADRWHRLGEIEWMPSMAVQHPVWGPVFGHGKELFAPTSGKLWTVKHALRGMSLNAAAPKPQWVGIAEDGQAVTLDLDNGRVLDKAKGEACAALHQSEGLLLRQLEQGVRWLRPDGTEGQRAFEGPVQSASVAGKYAAVLAGERLWILREDDSWAVAETAGKGYTAMDIDARNGAVYFLTKEDGLRVIYAR